MGKIHRIKDANNNIKYPLTVADAVIDSYKDGNTTKTATVHLRLQEIADIAATGGVTGVKGNSETTYRRGDVNITKANIGLGNVTNESKDTMFTNAALTGTPTAPTATAGTNTTQIATTAFVTTAVTNGIDGLDVTDTAVAGKYVSAVSETNGKISVTRADLPTQTDYSISVTKKGTPNTGAAASYTIAQSASNTSVDIDIPKDMVVSSGEVKTYTSSNAPTVGGTKLAAGTYLVLTLANATSDKVYINASSLIEYVTSGSVATDKIQISISNDHKVTASIKAGSIEKTDLSNALLASLDNADSSILTITTGSSNGSISVDGTDVAVKGLGAAAYKGVATSVSTSTDLITAKAVKDAGYTTNTGTVTKVTVGNGLVLNSTSAGGDITTTGTINMPAITTGSTTGTGVAGNNNATFTAVTGITTDSYGRVTSVEKTTLTTKNTTYSVATTSAAGLMSATDKTDLNRLVTNELTWEEVSGAKTYTDTEDSAIYSAAAATGTAA